MEKLKPIETYKFGNTTVEMYDDAVVEEEKIPEMLKRVGKINPANNEGRRVSA